VRRRKFVRRSLPPGRRFRERQIFSLPIKTPRAPRPPQACPPPMFFSIDNSQNTAGVDSQMKGKFLLTSLTPFGRPALQSFSPPSNRSSFRYTLRSFPRLVDEIGVPFSESRRLTLSDAKGRLTRVPLPVAPGACAGCGFAKVQRRSQVSSMLKRSRCLCF